MGQNNDTTERGELQGQQGAPKGKPRSGYMTMPDREGSNPFRGEANTDAEALRPTNTSGEDAPNAIPLPKAEG
jgi:hypothetical protein